MSYQHLRIEHDESICIIILNRPATRNAINYQMADELVAAFTDFDQNPALDVAVLTGAGKNFCAGADLKAIAQGKPNLLSHDSHGPLGPTRMQLGKPVIAAVEGFAVAGGLELAIWCDLRVAATDATFGVFCRRWGVPLIDGGTVRLPRLIGQSRALDMILTGRPIHADEALQFGLVNRVCPAGEACHVAVQLAKEIAAFPQQCVRNDRLSTINQWSLSWPDAIQHEFSLGLEVIQKGETLTGSQAFTNGRGRHGQFDN